MTAKVIIAGHTLFVILLTIFIWNAGSHMYKRQRIEDLETRLNNMEEATKTLNKTIFGKSEGVENLLAVKVTVTSYNPVQSQGWGTGLVTSDGNLAKPNGIAVSHDLKRRFNLAYGSKVIVKGYGVFIVTDTMNKRFTNRVDIISLIPAWSKAFGTNQSVLYIPRRKSCRT